MNAFYQVNFRRTPVVLVIAALAVAFELASQLNPAMRDVFRNNYKLGIWWQIWAGEYWRPLTTTLLHSGLIHLGMNMLALIAIGPLLELRLGSLRMLGLVVLLAYTSSLAQYVIGNYHTPVGDQSTMVGFSGVLFGLAGFGIVGRRYAPELAIVFTPQTNQFLLFWFVICIVATQAGVMAIGNLAHASGFIYGVLYGLGYFPTRWHLAWRIVAVLATLAMLATLVAAPFNPAYEHALYFGSHAAAR